MHRGAHGRLTLVVGALLGLLIDANNGSASQLQVCFSPPISGGCDPLQTVIAQIGLARRAILIQMYSLTSPEIATALVNSKNRGVDVRAIVDRSQLEQDQGDAGAVGRMASSGIPVLVDTVPGLMHNKIMIIDGKTVLTGSFNYTWSAEHRNAENLVVIDDPAVAAEYAQNWNSRAARSQPLNSPSELGSSSQDHALAAEAVIGNRRSLIYEWPGCPYYDRIAPRNRVSFSSRQAAEAAGYRPATNCP
jgi:phosphatidylserine/phosphatidylglycerophosphate/cardiolipin synthase-like enzyme